MRELPPGLQRKYPSPDSQFLNHYPTIFHMLESFSVSTSKAEPVLSGPDRSLGTWSCPSALQTTIQAIEPQPGLG